MSKDNEIKLDIPFNFTPRKYQEALLSYMDTPQDKKKPFGKRAVCVWHRRAGKDKTLINLMCKKMMERVGSYYYFFPTYKQGKKILWNGIDRDGFKFTKHIPEELRKRTDNTEMLVELVNGSIFQVIGTDRVDSVVGTNPVGCVYSEYALMDPRAWDFTRPILAENGGWAVFNFTPRGENHGFDIYNMAMDDPDTWFCEKLTVDSTGAINNHILEQEYNEIVRQHGDDALYQQEYFCSFNVPVQGAYYAHQIKVAESEGRFARVPYETGINVDTYWDLGIGDSTTIWFTQAIGREIRLIDYYENSGEGLSHYAKVLEKKNYNYGRHHAPHDIEVRELGTGRTRKKTAQNLGINFVVLPKLSREEGIEAARNIFSRCWFDEVKCKQGISALKNYRKEFDDNKKVYKNAPLHDWASHGADAFRYFAIGFRDRFESPELKRARKQTQQKWVIA